MQALKHAVHNCFSLIMEDEEVEALLKYVDRHEVLLEWMLCFVCNAQRGAVSNPVHEHAHGDDQSAHAATLFLMLFLFVCNFFLTHRLPSSWSCAHALFLSTRPCRVVSCHTRRVFST
jgi:hypothetical protein